METLLDWLSSLSHWQIIFLVSGLLLQGAVFTVFPEEIIITSLGVLWSQGRVSFVESLLAVQLGMLPANAFWVFLGSKLGRKVLDRRPFSLLFSRESIDRASERIQKFGLWIIVITRFTPLIRGPMYFALGLSGVKISKFTPIDAASSCVQIPILLLVGYKLGQNSASLVQAYERIAVVFAIIFVGLLIFMVSRKQRNAKGV